MQQLAVAAQDMYLKFQFTYKLTTKPNKFGLDFLRAVDNTYVDDINK